jgi:hypothetical protein
MTSSRFTAIRNKVLPAPITDALTRYLDEDEARTALDAACSAARDTRFDVAELFDWLQRYDADAALKQRANTALRAALGLPLIPGPPCRAG